MTEEQLLLASAVLVAGFVQGTLGFGFGMLAMAALPHWLGVRESVPVVSLLGLVICVSVYWRWRASFEFAAVRPLMIGVALGAPLGAYGLSRVDKELALGALGVVMLFVAWPSLVASLRSEAEEPRRFEALRSHGLAAGFVSGLFGGAFNAGGPPLILYASASSWRPARFRANLQVLFLFSSLLQLAVLASTGVATSASLELMLIGLPAVLVGVTLGGACAGRLATQRFRVIVWVLLLALAANYVRQAL